ncbi:MAG TPA: hypothetical protein VK044_09945 [Virgibacillus sp.]|nr:hypothetical protein [Virgibacillus sp.]
MLIHELSVLLVVINAVRLVNYRQCGTKEKKEYTGKAVVEID